MSNLMKAIYEDIEEYKALCDYYKESPVCDKNGPDPYSDHSHELQKRYYDIEGHSRW